MEHPNSEPGLQRLILDTARQLLTADGYAELSMRKIANKIGYSVTSIYLHFSNKDDLVHALIDEGVDLLAELLQEADRVGTNPAARLEQLCTAYIRFGLERPEYYEIMYVLHPEYIKRYPAEKYRKARRNLAMFSSAIEDGVEERIFWTEDPMLSANVIWSQLHGVVTLLISERVDKRISDAQLISATLHSILHSLTAVHSAERVK